MAGEESSRTPERAPAPDEHALLDHLIRPLHQRLRDSEPERLGGIEVDDQLELRRLLDREVGRLGPPENLDVISTLASCPA